MKIVTGGAGFFGEVIARRLLSEGNDVKIYDLNPPGFTHPRLTSVRGDIRDQEGLSAVMHGATTVYHNVAQVPLARNPALFWSINRDGTLAALEAALKAGAQSFVYTSSSAVFGVPKSNPVTETTVPSPAEDYGRAKLAGEKLCEEFSQKGLRVSIIRPRTILGRGRLGIFQILFEWIHRGLNIPVIGSGDNVYQFVHAEDLARACIQSGESLAEGTFNIGADGFGTMRQTLEHLIAHAGSKSCVRSVPRRFANLGIRTTSWLRLTPLAPYHALMYGESLYFDTSKAKSDLGFRPQYTQDQTFADTYDWYEANRLQVLRGEIAGSRHQSRLRQGLLALAPYLI